MGCLEVRLHLHKTVCMEQAPIPPELHDQYLATGKGDSRVHKNQSGEKGMYKFIIR